MRFDDSRDSLNDVNLGVYLCSLDHVILSRRFNLLKLVVVTGHCTNIIMSWWNSMDLRRWPHWSYWPFWLRDISPDGWKSTLEVLVGRRDRVSIGREVLIVIGILNWIVIHWRGDSRREAFKVHFRERMVRRWGRVGIDRVHIVILVKPLIWLSIHLIYLL